VRACTAVTFFAGDRIVGMKLRISSRPPPGGAAVLAARARPRAADLLGQAVHATVKGTLLLLLVGRVEASASAGAGAAIATGPTAGQPGRTVMLELFTSQGCSACPGADAFVRALPALGYGRDRVVPLAFHVDDWDDLGWHDPFASPTFSARQRAYVRSGMLVGPEGERAISGAYTPQMIIDGHVHFSGQQRQRAIAEIERAAASPPRVVLVARAALLPTVAAGANGVTDAGVQVRVEISRPDRPALASSTDGNARRDVVRPEDRLPATWRLWVAVVQRAARTAVARGENGGETLEEAAVVRRLSAGLALADAKGRPVEVLLTVPRELEAGQMEIVAFVQDLRSLQILAVTSTGLDPRP